MLNFPNSLSISYWLLLVWGNGLPYNVLTSHPGDIFSPHTQWALKYKCVTNPLSQHVVHFPAWLVLSSLWSLVIILYIIEPCFLVQCVVSKSLHSLPLMIMNISVMTLLGWDYAQVFNTLSWHRIFFFFLVSEWFWFCISLWNPVALQIQYWVMYICSHNKRLCRLC